MRGPGSPAEWPRNTYHSGIRCGQPRGPAVAHVTVRSSARKAAASASLILICSRRLTSGGRGCDVGLAQARDGRTDGLAGVIRLEHGGVPRFSEDLADKP